MTSLALSRLSIGRPADRTRTIGVLAAFGAVLIWSAWVVGTRHAVTHALDPLALGFLRFAVPAVVFAPVWWRSGLRPRGVSRTTMLGLMGAGAPFFITVALAMHHATAAEIGPLLPGTMPLFVAVLSIALFGERPGRTRGLGLILIFLGVATIGGRDLLTGSHGWQAHGLLLAGSAMWAIYTLAYKHSGLSSLVATATVSAWSALALAPFGVPSLIAAVHAGLAIDIIAQAVIQGVLSGVVAILLYGLAIARLGASGGAAFVALVPALAAIIAIPVLGEWPDATAIIGIVATTFGVGLSVGAADCLRRPAMPALTPASHSRTSAAPSALR
jgi:drug/metabolite transporter (DMT)-like permease